MAKRGVFRGLAGVFCAGLSVAAHAFASSYQDQYYGSLYPDDVSVSVDEGDGVTDSAQGDRLAVPIEATKASLAPVAPARRYSPASEIARALGPAGYIVETRGLDPAFASKIRVAVGVHPAFHAQASMMDDARAERRRARAALYPQLSTSLRADYSLTRDFAADTDNVVESLRPREQVTAGLSASQLVFDGGATFQRIKSAGARRSEFENALSTRINDLSLAALSAYHDLATHQALTVIGQAFIARHEKILADVKERERLGAGSYADVTRASARLAASRARVSEIRESARLAEIRYEEFFKEKPGNLTRPDFAALAVDNREDAVLLAVDRNPEIAAAAARAEASRADFKAARGARLPEVRVSVDATKFDVLDSGDDFDVRAGLNVNYNIFGGGARAAEISLANSRARREKFNEDQVRQEVEREAAIAFERREGAIERVATLEDAVVAHDKTRDLVLERYKVSRGELIDVLQAENDYFDSAISYLAALASLDMATYALMEHTGDLLRYFSPQEEHADLLREPGDG